MRRAFESAIRSVGTVAECPRLTRLSLHAPKSVEVEFDNGNAYNLSAEYLRVYSPAVDSKIRSIGGEKKVIRALIRLYPGGVMSGSCLQNLLETMELLFDDLHKTGIFTWDYFYYLGTNKFSLMRNYIKTLKKHGLSREPAKKKQTAEGTRSTESSSTRF